MTQNPQLLYSQFGLQGWYPNDSGQLEALLTKTLNLHPPSNSPSTKGLICPHAGYTYCGDIFAQAMGTIKHGQYSKALIIGPSHYHPLKNQAVLTRYTGIQTPLGIQAIDQEATNTLQALPYFDINDMIHDPEHSIQMHIPFLQVLFPDLPVVPIIVGDLSLDTSHSLAISIQSVIDPETLVMISSDFTHYGDRFAYLPFSDPDPDQTYEKIKSIDMGAITPILENNLETYSDYIRSTKTTICGRFAIELLLQLCQDSPSQFTLHDYQSSGDVTGHYHDCVSYAALTVQGDWT